MKNIKKIFLFTILGAIFAVFSSVFFAFAQENLKIYLFYGKGCPHCLKADKFLSELKEKHPKIEIEKHEVYFHPENLELFKKFCSEHKTQANAVPMIFIKDKYFKGFGKETGREIEKYLQSHLSGENIVNKEKETKTSKTSSQKLTLTKILSLAVVDSINPCAMAVLTLILIAILTYNPASKKNVLLAGLYFVGSVFIMYLIYGLVIIKFFQIIQVLSGIRPYLYKILGGMAILLGILNIKDFIKYKPGGFLTEMPLFLRPKVKKIISGIASPKGAFGVGIFVTLFLLPCTIGPYIIAGGILSVLKVLKSLPYLLLYNLIFILPMLAITLLVYFGLSKIEDISGWKEKNIRYLHLTAGIIILGLGILIIFGLV